MNIKDIKATPVFTKLNFRQYDVDIKAVIAEKHISNWIDNLQCMAQPECLREWLLSKNYTATLTVRHFDNGEIKEMIIDQNSTGKLCCMHYYQLEDWEYWLNELNKGVKVDE